MARAAIFNDKFMPLLRYSLRMSLSPTWSGYAWAIGAAVGCTLVGLTMQPRFDLVNIAMVYLLAVVVVALEFSHGPAVLASILSVAAFDVLFVPPRGTFTVDDVQYLLTFAIMLAVGLIISGLVRSIRRQAAAQAALEIEAETERIRSALLASISHDLRTPLAVMAGASSSLADNGERLSAAERHALAKSVFEQAREMSEHVNKVLQMTRLETGAIKVERDWVSLPEIAGSVLSRLEVRLASHRVIIELPDDLPLVRVDAALIEQALGNLLENCAKHTPPGTIVRVRAEPRPGEILVSVEDYSGGIPDANVERVFEKFNRGSVEDTGTGMGLGLPICRAIVRLHGGKAWAERVPAGGTAFRFTLPLEEAPPVPSEAAD
jgi:K+-sensing histidine kinase KdpD